MSALSLTVGALALTVVFSTSGCIVHVGGQNEHSKDVDYSRIFGGLDIAAHHPVQDLSSVNGGIELQDGVSAHDVETVNGGIQLGKNVQLHDASTVNGDIDAESGLTTQGNLSTINGSVRIQTASVVGGNISTINGDINVISSRVAGNLQTTSGDISLSKATSVQGDIVFTNKNEDSWWSDNVSTQQSPTLSIDLSSTVRGRIILKRKVLLKIADPDLLARVEQQYKTTK
jgi:hypothetical protein